MQIITVFLFGKTHVYTPDYYDDILIRRQIKYFEQTIDGFADMLKSEIQNGYYIYVMLNPFQEKEWSHEIVLYGYDDHNRIFKTVGLENIGLSMQFQYPMCAFKLRDDYCAEGCVFEAFRKIRAEF